MRNRMTWCRVGVMSGALALLAGGCKPMSSPTEQTGKPRSAIWHPEALDLPDRNGRLANLELRSGSEPNPGEWGQGHYLEGEPMPEFPQSDGSVRIGELQISAERYAILQQSRFVPFRREMTDAELLEAIHPDLRARHRDDLSAMVRAMHAELRRVPDYPGPLWEMQRRLSPGELPQGAESTYAEWFDDQGKLRERDWLWSSPPGRELGLWSVAYRSTGDARWARAVVEVMERYYRTVRPPVGKIGDRASQARHLWRTLNLGAGTPGYLEAYANVSDWPGLNDRQRINFLKGAIERARYLHFTTTPAFPWLRYNPYGYANWLLYQLQGELAIALAFPGLKEAAQWQAHATEGIALQAAWSVQPDGSHDEFSYDYAGQVLGQLRWCLVTLLRYGHEVPMSLKRDLLRLNELFLELYLPRKAKLPFGDSHPRDGAVPHAARWAALLYLDPRFKAFADEPERASLEQIAAIVAPDAPQQWIAAYEALPAEKPSGRTSSILPDAGWAVLRSGWEERDHAVSTSWRGSDRVAHSGRDHLGINIWAAGHPVIRKLLGTRSYNGEYPEGYHNTARVNNMVILTDPQGALLPFARESGFLRNAYSSSTIDLIDAEHRGWAGGRVTARRRMLYLKPDWLVVIDDLEASTPLRAQSQWQAHVGGEAPKVVGHRALWQRGEAFGMAWVSPASLEAEALAVKGGAPTYLLKAVQPVGEWPARWVSIFHFGTGEAPAELEVRALSEPDCDGVVLPTKEGPREVMWEKRGSDRPAFLAAGAVAGGKDSQGRFLATDPGGSFRDWSHSAAHCWHEGHWPNGAEASGGSILDFRQLPWSGQPQLKEGPVVLARFAWRTEAPAVQSLEYRRVGETRWRRVLQPGVSREAWLLAPVFTRGEAYEVRAVAELASGEMLYSSISSISF